MAATSGSRTTARAQPFTRSDGQRYVGTRGDQGNGASQGSYRGGAASASGGQQHNQPLDPRAAATRDRTVPGTTARTDGSGGTYRSSGAVRTSPQRDAALVDSTQRLSGAVPGGRQQNQPIRNRDPNQSYRSAPPPSADSQAGAAVPPQGDAPVARTPGQYRSSGGMSQALRQSQSRMVTPSVRVAPPPSPSAERSSVEPRSGNGGGSVYRSERAAPPRAQSDAPSSSGGDSGGGSPAASSYRGGGGGDGGGGGESRSSGGRNTNQPVRGGR